MVLFQKQIFKPIQRDRQDGHRGTAVQAICMRFAMCVLPQIGKAFFMYHGGKQV
jgi:hypothetical protein